MADTRRIEILIRNMHELPTIPSVFFVVNKMLSDPRTSAIDIGQVVSNDQVIASKILKLANSAFYGLIGKVNTVPHAIAVLGFNTTKNIVLTTSILTTLKLKNNVEGFSLPAFWKHSVAVGVLAKLTAMEVYPQKREEAFVAGLLHDIGKLILAICAPEDFVNCISLAVSKNCLFMDAEREILGICHADIAALVNERWHLPAEIADVMVNHHNDIDISNEHAKMLAVVKLADVLARGLQFGYACDNTVPVIENKVFSLLDITPKKLDAILTASHEALQNSMDYISED